MRPYVPEAGSGEVRPLPSTKPRHNCGKKAAAEPTDLLHAYHYTRHQDRILCPFGEARHFQIEGLHPLT